MKHAGVVRLGSAAILLLDAAACHHARAVAAPIAPPSVAIQTLARETRPHPGTRAKGWPELDGDASHLNRDKGGRFVWDRETPNTVARPIDADEEQSPPEDDADAGSSRSAKR